MKIFIIVGGVEKSKCHNDINNFTNGLDMPLNG